MAHHVIKLEKYYLEWSTVLDAPITIGTTLARFKTYYRRKYGSEGIKYLQERMYRLEEKSIASSYYNYADDLIKCNRAGPDETCLKVGELIKVYCKLESFNGFSVTTVGNSIIIDWGKASTEISN